MHDRLSSRSLPCLRLFHCKTASLIPRLDGYCVIPRNCCTRVLIPFVALHPFPAACSCFAHDRYFSVLIFETKTDVSLASTLVWLVAYKVRMDARAVSHVSNNHVISRTSWITASRSDFRLVLGHSSEVSRIYQGSGTLWIQTADDEVSIM